jgi:DNA-binding MurR/RpiR family transcriptional regulator
VPKRLSKEAKLILREISRRTTLLKPSIRELSRNVGVSPSALSEVLRGVYPSDCSEMIGRLRTWLRSHSMSIADEKKFVQVLAILDACDRDQNVIAALIERRYRAEGL